MKFFSSAITICWALALCFTGNLLWGQVSSRPLQVGLGLAAHRYQGDLTHQEANPWRMHPGLSVLLQFQSPRRMQLALEGGFGKFVEQVDQLPGPNGNRPSRPNPFVETNFFYTELRLRLRIVKQGPWQPYLGAGGGLVFFTPRDQGGNFLSDNLFTREPNETYGTFAPQLPLNAGLRWQPSPRLGVECDYSFRLLGSDYLDNQGQLGTQPGNDRLQQLRLSMVLTLNGGDAAPRPVSPEPAPPAPAPTVAQFSAPYWLALYPELGKVPQAKPGVEPARFRPVGPERASRTVVLAELMSWRDLGTHFRHPVRLLRSLNPQLTAPLTAGTEIRLP